MAFAPGEDANCWVCVKKPASIHLYHMIDLVRQKPEFSLSRMWACWMQDQISSKGISWHESKYENGIVWEVPTSGTSERLIHLSAIPSGNLAEHTTEWFLIFAPVYPLLLLKARTKSKFYTLEPICNMMNAIMSL